MISVKIHDNGVVAICDEELIGKVFRDGKLHLKVSEFFYKGRIMDEDEVKKIMKDAENINIIGKKSIEIALKLKIINKDSIIEIGGVPHAQVIS